MVALLPGGSYLRVKEEKIINIVKAIEFGRARASKGLTNMPVKMDFSKKHVNLRFFTEITEKYCIMAMLVLISFSVP